MRAFVEHAGARLAVTQMQLIECTAFMLVLLGTGLPRMQEHLAQLL